MDLKEKNKPTMHLYHYMKAHDKFESTANMLVNLIYEAQKSNPDHPRILYLDIKGHRNKLGGYDQDAYELMSEFIPKHLLMWLTVAHTPLGTLTNPYQMNDVPEGVEITGEVE